MNGPTRMSASLIRGKSREIDRAKFPWSGHGMKIHESVMREREKGLGKVGPGRELSGSPLCGHFTGPLAPEYIYPSSSSSFRHVYVARICAESPRAEYQKDSSSSFGVLAISFH